MPRCRHGGVCVSSGGKSPVPGPGSRRSPVTAAAVASSVTRWVAPNRPSSPSTRRGVAGDGSSRQVPPASAVARAVPRPTTSLGGRVHSTTSSARISRASAVAVACRVRADSRWAASRGPNATAGSSPVTSGIGMPAVAALGSQAPAPTS